MFLALVCWVVLHAQAPAPDPFDALASILPSADAIAPKQPVYTGPEVKEVQHSHSVPVCVCVGGLFDCTELQHGSAVSNRVCCMYHSMELRPRRLPSVERETTRCLQTTDLTIWSVLLISSSPSSSLLLIHWLALSLDVCSLSHWQTTLSTPFIGTTSSVGSSSCPVCGLSIVMKMCLKCVFSMQTN